ncbi:MAG: histidine kinase [Chitinophagaceae bacterium]|nr:histidine kinase [Chitinophagaceae bacterium]
MRLKPLLFLLIFAAFYILLHLAYDMPYIIHGNSRFIEGIDTRLGLARRFIDICSSSLFAMISYFIFFRFYPEKKWIRIVLLLLLILPIIFFAGYWLESWVNLKLRSSYSSFTRLRTYFLDHLFYIILYVIYGIAFYFIRYAYFRELQQKELALQNRESELSFLRSQINPHFLFNGLNNIYSLVYLQSPNSLEAISGFSDLLRYMLYDTTQDVPLEKEAHYIRQYISLQELKQAGSIRFRFDVQGPVGKIFIPPLLLIPFVENAFKHGAPEDDEIIISIQSSSVQTMFYCQNKKSSHRKDASGGIGLQNVRRRLELLFPDKHRLSILDGPVFFIVKLEIDHE